MSETPTSKATSSTETDRDDAINRAFEFLVDDDLEAFATVAIVDGELHAISLSPLDENPAQLKGYDAACQLPRSSLLGKLLADFSVMFGNDPTATATVAAHVATDHLGVDEEYVDRALAAMEVGDA